MKKLFDIGRELLWPALCALIMLVIGLTSASLTAFNERQRIDSQVSTDNAIFADNFFSKLQLILDQAEDSTSTLAFQVQSRGIDFTSPEDQWFLDQLATSTVGWRNLSVAPNNCISAVAPRSGNEAALGYCLTANPEEAINIAKIIETGQPTFFGPLELAQDARGFLYDNPVYLLDGSYWGMTTAVLDENAFVRPLLAVARQSSMAVMLSMSNAVEKNSQELFSTFDGELPFTNVTRFVDDGATFTLTSAPLMVSYQSAERYFARILFGAIVLAIVAFVAVYAFRRQHKNALKLELLTKRSPSVLFHLSMSKDGSLELDYLSEGATQLLGFTPEEILDNSRLLLNCIDPHDRSAAVERMRSVKSPGEIWSQRLRYDHPHLGKRWLQVEATFERQLAGTSGWNGIFVDATSFALQEQQLAVSAGVFSSMNEGVAILDNQWRVVDINPGVTKNTGFTSEDLIGKNFGDFGSGLNVDALYTSMREAVTEHGYWRGEIVNRHKSGRISKDMLTMSSVVNDEGTLTHIIVVMNSIEKMLIDSVTGLPNRTHFEEHLAESIERARDDEKSLALLEITITGVGAVNDSFGYKIGDLLLHELGERIAEFTSDNRSIGRVGDTTFGLVKTFDEEVQTVEELCKQLLAVLATPFTYDDVSVLVTPAIGIAVLDPQSHTVEELRSHAGQAAKAALEDGGSTYRYFTSRMETGAKVRSYLTSDLQEAIKNHALTFFYQPIVRVSDRQIVKAEALARWFDDHLGEVSPGRFIPLAEESGLIHELGAQLFEDCIATAIELQRLGRPITVSLNVSPVEIMSSSFARHDRIAHAVEAGLDPRNIVFELTEGILLNRKELIEERIRSCREQGIRFAIDDFGTGYSSLAYLQQLDVDFIKIDKVFIDKIDTESGYALCRSIIELAHALGLEVIAEGVETELQLSLLDALGCEFAQGYLFSRALPKNAFMELLGFKQG